MTKTTISAKIVADSISKHGTRITTFELEYPRFIHAEFNTHRVFSRNAASSRAIPVERTIDLIKRCPAAPIHWGKNQPGMQAVEELLEPNRLRVKSLWNSAKEGACSLADEMSKEGAHKQIANRILEPFQIIKVVMTATEMDNFYNLRIHKDAQPEIQELATKMLEAQTKSHPYELRNGEWHVPYFNAGMWNPSFDHTFEEALAVSVSCCAQVSFRKLDDSMEKAKNIYDRLIGSKPIHASPFEHQATPMRYPNLEVGAATEADHWEEGVTHMDRNGDLWSGNLKGWIQHRQLLLVDENEDCI